MKKNLELASKSFYEFKPVFYKIKVINYTQEPMSSYKQQKDTGKAIGHIMKYADKGSWYERKLQYYDEMWGGVVDELGVSDEMIIDCLDRGGFLANAMAYLFGEFSCLRWNDENYSMVDDYLKKSGWRESPYGKKYLRAMTKNVTDLWEVIGVKSGEYIDVKRLGEDNVQRVYETTGSQTISQWSWLAVKVIVVEGKKMLSGSGFAFSPQKFDALMQYLSRKQDLLEKELKQIKKQDASINWSIKEIMSMAGDQMDNNSPDLTFTFWVADIYRTMNQSAPVLLNKDDEKFKDIVLKFPISGENHAKTLKLLNSADYLDPVKEDKRWAWIGCKINEIPEAGTSLLGELILYKKSLKLSVNSDGRADRGRAYLDDILGDLIGKPLILENNIDNKLAKMKAGNIIQKENSIDELEIMASYMDKHYKKVLDEQVPALANKSPRECSKDETMIPLLIQWLKGLENSSAKVPQLKAYDFRWMWAELGIEYPGTNL